MEPNEEVRLILLEFHELITENNWNKSQIRWRSIYDTFRIQNILNKT